MTGLVGVCPYNLKYINLFSPDFSIRNDDLRLGILIDISKNFRNSKLTNFISLP